MIVGSLITAYELVLMLCMMKYCSGLTQQLFELLAGEKTSFSVVRDIGFPPFTKM